VSRFEFVHAKAADTSVRRLCRLLRVSPSGYYAWTKRKRSRRDISEERLVTKMRAIQAQTQQCYGSPRMYDDLRADNETVGVHRVARLMKKHGLNAIGKKRYINTTTPSGSREFCPNILNRNFKTEQPNKVWVGDITCIPIYGGFAYLAVLIDLHSRAVVGWKLKKTLHTDLPLDALKSAIATRQPHAGFIHHSDRGSQYDSSEYRRFLRKHGALQSMSRKGNCWDNAVAESFFASLKKERVRNKTYVTFSDAYRDVESYIDGFYNPHRRHSTIGGISPYKFEAMHRQSKSPN